MARRAVVASVSACLLALLAGCAGQPANPGPTPNTPVPTSGGTPAPWGTVPRYLEGTARTAQPAELAAIDAARHEEFDRGVFRFDGGRPDTAVSYADQPAAAGSGPATDLLGQAVLRVVFSPVARAGEKRLFPQVRMVEEIRQLPASESLVEVGVGVRHVATGRSAAFRVGIDGDDIHLDVRREPTPSSTPSPTGDTTALPRRGAQCTSVPTYPASHGCVRVTLPAMEWMWDAGQLPIGTPVWVY